MAQSAMGAKDPTKPASGRFHSNAHQASVNFGAAPLAETGS
jgi:hypothetical protein